MKINIITGGSRGLGRSMALHLAGKGQDSIITYHSKKAAAEAVVEEIHAKGRKAVALHLDVSKSETFDGFVTEVYAGYNGPFFFPAHGIHTEMALQMKHGFSFYITQLFKFNEIQ